MTKGGNGRTNLGLAREKAAKLSQNIRHLNSLLKAAESLQDDINPRAANGLQELFDVLEVIKAMTHRINQEGEEIEGTMVLLCARAQDGAAL